MFSEVEEEGGTPERRFCAQHSGMIEKIKAVDGKLNIIMWLMGITLAVISVGVGLVHESYQHLDSNLSVTNTRLSGIDSRITIDEATDQRLTDRVLTLEQKDSQERRPKI